MSQKSDKRKNEDAVKSEKIRELINEKRFVILQNVDMVIRLNVSKTLIEGTTDEYYNKLSVRDTITGPKANVFQNTLQDDSSYAWDVKINETSFDPEQQFLIKGKEGQLTVLLDSKAKLLGFIDLYGQEIISLNPELIFFSEPD